MYQRGISYDRTHGSCQGTDDSTHHGSRRAHWKRRRRWWRRGRKWRGFRRVAADYHELSTSLELLLFPVPQVARPAAVAASAIAAVDRRWRGGQHKQCLSQRGELVRVPSGCMQPMRTLSDAVKKDLHGVLVLVRQGWLIRCARSAPSKQLADQQQETVPRHGGPAGAPSDTRTVQH